MILLTVTADDGGQVPDIWWKYKYFSEDSRRTGGTDMYRRSVGGQDDGSF